MNEWIWTYEGYDPDQAGQREALCTLGNGYVASRGALPECDADDTHYPGTYIAGVFNRLTTEVAGRDVVNESIVNAPNWLPLAVRPAGGEWFTPDSTEVLEHCLDLDIRRGELTRRTRMRDSQGRVLSLTQRRFISLRDPHLLALESTIVAENFEGSLEVRSALDGRVTNFGVERYRSLDSDNLEHVRSTGDGEVIRLEVRTNDSGVAIAEAARTRVRRGGQHIDPARTTEASDRYVEQLIRLDCTAGEELIVEKVVAVHTSKDLGIYSASVASDEAVRNAGTFDELLARHVTTWAHAWNRSGLRLAGDVGHTARVLNLHLFHLLQTVSKNATELDVGVPARGLHGEAYRGHIFWDELFIFPYLTIRVPEITRALLRYRARRLDRARQVAREAGFEGALYPWQSGSDGREETQTLHLNPESGHWLPDASHLQRHINAAVVVNVWRYWQATGDLEFLRFWGAEMILEIARFWASAATYNHALDRYEIKGVMGPDEYHEGYPDRDEPGLDNNAYTNVMAVWCLCRAFDVLEVLPASRRRELEEKLGITREEMDRWDDISNKMRLCFHGDRILSQFEGYEQLEELDWDAYRERYGNIGRLDRILEAEGDSPNRYKLSKQADTLMLFYVLSASELVEIWDRLGYDRDDDFFARNIEYYESRTSHGSTLSQMVHSWLHSRLDRAKSWSLFRDTLASDINDVQGGTTAEGIHLGAMAGTVDLVQRCYGGVEAREDVLYLNPRLPAELHELSFSVIYRGQPVDIEVSATDIGIHLPADSGNGSAVALEVTGQFALLEPGDTLRVPLD